MLYGVGYSYTSHVSSIIDWPVNFLIPRVNMGALVSRWTLPRALSSSGRGWRTTCCLASPTLCGGDRTGPGWKYRHKRRKSDCNHFFYVLAGMQRRHTQCLICSVVGLINDHAIANILWLSHRCHAEAYERHTVLFKWPQSTRHLYHCPPMNQSMDNETTPRSRPRTHSMIYATPSGRLLYKNSSLTTSAKERVDRANAPFNQRRCLVQNHPNDYSVQYCHMIARKYTRDEDLVSLILPSSTFQLKINWFS